jgi:hypothetical protein
MAKQIQDDETFLAIRDVAVFIKCSDRHITTLRKSGKIPQPVTGEAILPRCSEETADCRESVCRYEGHGRSGEQEP